MTDRYRSYIGSSESGVPWVGAIPSTWDLVKGRRLFKSIREASRAEDEQLSATQDQGVVPQKLLMANSDRRVVQALKGTESFRHVDENDFVISLRSFQGGIEHSAYSGCVSPAYTVLRAAKDIHTPYFKRLFKSYGYISALQTSTDSLRDGKAISYEAFGEILLPVPPKTEQKAIARFLDHETGKIDQLIAKQERLIELLKEKRQAVITHAVTKGLDPDARMKDSGVEWLGEVPEHWGVARIKNLATSISKGTTPSTIGADLTNEGVRFLKGENIGKSLRVSPAPEFYISKEVDRQLSRSRLEENDVLVIIAGATTGMASILQAELLPANTNQAVSFIRPRKSIYARLIAQWLSTEFAQRIIWTGAVQSAQPNLSMEDLGNIPIVVPPLEELELLLDKISLKMAKIDQLLLRAEESTNLLSERRSALISAAVTGKIDVRQWQSKCPTAETESVAV
ncbi:restriction endonuclease subunit S [Microbulbifer sp. JSM ZJ756]|uniref:restriction endonuclease subunit S n=1 Tax=Microbulbifer sp. JSM ZJ756 TaxID=3376191 RepID=UPI0037A9D603